MTPTSEKEVDVSKSERIDAEPASVPAGIKAFCPACWALIPFDASSCRVCGADVGSLTKRDYETKLVSALSHPLTHVRERAALLLGAVGSAVAFGPLLEKAHDDADPWLAAAALRGLEILRRRHPELPRIEWQRFAGPDAPVLVRFAADEIAARADTHAIRGSGGRT
jgi:HEAT repeat protein